MQDICPSDHGTLGNQLEALNTHTHTHRFFNKISNMINKIQCVHYSVNVCVRTWEENLKEVFICVYKYCRFELPVHVNVNCVLIACTATEFLIVSYADN